MPLNAAKVKSRIFSPDEREQTGAAVAFAAFRLYRNAQAVATRHEVPGWLLPAMPRAQDPVPPGCIATIGLDCHAVVANVIVMVLWPKYWSRNFVEKGPCSGA